MGTRLKTPRNSSNRFRRLSLPTVIVVAAILALGAVTVVSRQKIARDQSSKAPAAIEAAATKENFVTVKVAGRDVHMDTQTGQISELTAEESEKLATGLRQMIDQSTEGLVQVQHADGSVSVNLEERFQNVTVARVNRNGSVAQSCVDNPQAAGAFFGIDPKLIEHQPQTSTKNQSQ